VLANQLLYVEHIEFGHCICFEIILVRVAAISQPVRVSKNQFETIK
jgi:hypothetical protein